MRKYLLAILILLCSAFAFTGCQCEHEWIDATCENPCICSLCGETTGKALGHVEQKLSGIISTCEDMGLTDGAYCIVCGETVIEQTTIPPQGHTVVKSAEINPTCTTDGLTSGESCAVCGEIFVEQEIVNAIGHKPIQDSGVASTCTEEGLTDGSHCSICGESIIKQTIIPVKEHEFSSWVMTKEASCVLEGQKQHACVLCGFKETVTVPAYDHSWQAATCTRPQMCSRCGLATGTVTDHDWKPATYLEPKTCYSCGATSGDVDQKYFQELDLLTQKCEAQLLSIEDQITNCEASIEAATTNIAYAEGKLATLARDANNYAEQYVQSINWGNSYYMTQAKDRERQRYYDEKLAEYNRIISTEARNIELNRQEITTLQQQAIVTVNKYNADVQMLQAKYGGDG